MSEELRSERFSCMSLSKELEQLRELLSKKENASPDSNDTLLESTIEGLRKDLVRLVVIGVRKAYQTKIFNVGIEESRL